MPATSLFASSGSGDKRLLPGEGEQPPGEGGPALDALASAGKQRPDVSIPARQPSRNQFQAAAHHRQHVVEVVRDAAGELANRLQPLQVAQLGFGLLAPFHLGDQAHVGCTQLACTLRHPRLKRPVEIFQALRSVAQFLRYLRQRAAELGDFIDRHIRRLDDQTFADLLGRGRDGFHRMVELAGNHKCRDERADDQQTAKCGQIPELIGEWRLQRFFRKPHGDRPSAIGRMPHCGHGRNAFKRHRGNGASPCAAQMFDQVGHN